MKNKIKLEQLRVKSFITDQKSFDVNTIKGGQDPVPVVPISKIKKPPVTGICLPSPDEIIQEMSDICGGGN